MNKVIVVRNMNVDLFVKTENLPQVGETILGKTFPYFVGGKDANQVSLPPD